MSVEILDDRVRVTGMVGLEGWAIDVIHDGSISIVPPDGFRVDVAAWRKVPLAHVLAEARRAMIHKEPGAESIGRKRRPSNEAVLQQVHVARTSGVSVLTQISTAFGVSRATSERWIRAAAEEYPDKFPDRRVGRPRGHV